jgi:hypothetical protein
MHEKWGTANLCPRRLEGLTKTATRNAEDEKWQNHSFQNAQGWRGVRVLPADEVPYLRVVLVAAAAAVEILKVNAKGGRAGALDGHCRWKFDGRRLTVDPGQTELSPYLLRCGPHALRLRDQSLSA